MRRLLMGNEAIALGALHAGVKVCAGYPGTPSSEILDSVVREKSDDVYVEWSVNEKAGLEVAAGAAIAGSRAMATMKQVGLNAAADPLMSLAYLGVKGGLVIVVADDPGPISSQTEQDTRNYARLAKVPIFDPASPQEAYAMMEEAFDLSERYGTPVILRPTTRVCHGTAAIDVKEGLPKETGERKSFEKNSRWVIFPRLSYNNHLAIEKRNPIIGKEFSSYEQNTLTGTGKKGIVASGISYAYAMEALEILGASPADYRLCKVATPFPFPEDLGVTFLKETQEVLVLEELDPVIQRELLMLAGREQIPCKIRGKLTGDLPNAGEYSASLFLPILADYLGKEMPQEVLLPQLPALPIRPPVLCAGCPHRASFLAVKEATKGKRAIFTGDIGCYTLGNAMPLDMVDTCLCMGASFTVGQGIKRQEEEALIYAFLGDSTFFHSGITGAVNAVYNQTPMVLCILDNETTAMTGHQPHPGTGETMMKSVSPKISIEKVLEAIGIEDIFIHDPLDLKGSIEVAKKAGELAKEKVTAIIFRSPCIFKIPFGAAPQVNSPKCIACRICVNKMGCPAIVDSGEKGKVKIDTSLCSGCNLCIGVCPHKAIEKGGAK